MEKATLKQTTYMACYNKAENAWYICRRSTPGRPEFGPIFDRHTAAHVCLAWEPRG